MATIQAAAPQPLRMSMAAESTSASFGVRSLRLPTKASGRTTSRRLRIVNSVASDVPAAATAEEAAWVKLFPVDELPKGERRLVRQGPDTILMFWYRNELRAVENSSPAEGAYSEGLFNARLTQEGGITCPTSDTVFDIRTGEVLQWYPNNWAMRTFTTAPRRLQVYDVKVEDGQVLVDFGKPVAVAQAAEVYGREVKVGQTASDVNVNETRMVIAEDAGGFGFTPENELTNGRAAMMGFMLLLVIEVVTGKGLLATTGFLDFLYRAGLGGPVL